MSAPTKPRAPRRRPLPSQGGAGRDPSGRASRRLPRWLRRTLWALGILAALVLLHVPILIGVAKVLIVDDTPGKADEIVILGGNLDFRPQKAAELYRAGVAPRIVLARVQDLPAEQMEVYPNETDASVKMLALLGVPDSAIVVLSKPGGVTSTIDEARLLRSYLEPRGESTVLLVTSLPHTRRARWAYRRELKGLPVILRVAAAQDPRFNQRNWWKSETGLIQFFEEYLKFAHNLVYR